MDTVELQPKQSRKGSALRGKSTKAPALKNEVIVRRAMGQSKSVIAKQLKIAPNTVASIVALSNIDDMLESGRLSVHQLIPKSVNVMDERLDKGSESAAIEILRGTGVLKSKSDVQINIAAVSSNSWYQRKVGPTEEVKLLDVSNSDEVNKQ